MMQSGTGKAAGKGQGGSWAGEPKFFDAHTHVQFKAYDTDREAVLARAGEAGVWMINVGTQRDTSRAAVELAERAEMEAAKSGDATRSGVFAAIGLHPVHTSRSFHDEAEIGGGEAATAFTSRGEAFDIERYRPLALHKKTVAIGECGLDYFHFNEDESREEQIGKQKEAFIAQIELAIEVKKPLMIHCRNGTLAVGTHNTAFADLIEILKFYEKRLDGSADGEEPRRSPGVIHFFAGTPDDARALLALGFSFTFGGAITFPPRKTEKENQYHELIRLIPLDRILSETDAPYVAPLAYRGKRNEPAYVVEVVKKLAELKGIAAAEMKAQIWENAKLMFGIAQ
jgi:TatD DNase family protein